jgi:hypothetical protein
VLLETAMRRGVTCKYILWQYLTCYLVPDLKPEFERKRRLATAANSCANREPSSPVKPATREPSSPVKPATREPSSPKSGKDYSDPTRESEGRAAAAAPKGAAEDIPIPGALDTPDFRAARDAWFAQRRRRRLSLRPEFVARQYARLLPLGAADAAACLRYTLDNDYQGLCVDRFAHGSQKRAGPGRIGPGQRYDPSTADRDPGM